MRVIKYKKNHWRENKEIWSWLPALQSHRGYWMNGIQQNTLQSISESFNLGYQMVEFDVRLTQDKKVVLFHDEHIDSIKVSSLTYNNLKDRLHTKNLKLDLLENVFQWYVENNSNVDFNFKLNIEIKSKHIFDDALEYQIVKLIKKFNLQNFCLISSFNPFVLRRIRLLDSQIFTALLVTESEESNFIASRMLLNKICKPDVLHLRYQDHNYEKFKDIGSKIPIVLWTVNDFEIYKTKKNEVFGVISDSIKPSELN